MKLFSTYDPKKHEKFLKDKKKILDKRCKIYSEIVKETKKLEAMSELDELEFREEFPYLRKICSNIRDLSVKLSVVSVDYGVENQKHIQYLEDTDGLI